MIKTKTYLNVLWNAEEGKDFYENGSLQYCDINWKKEIKTSSLLRYHGPLNRSWIFCTIIFKVCEYMACQILLHFQNRRSVIWEKRPDINSYCGVGKILDIFSWKNETLFEWRQSSHSWRWSSILLLLTCSRGAYLSLQIIESVINSQSCISLWIYWN